MYNQSMKKRKTNQIHRIIANNLMYYIIHHIDTDLNIDEIAHDFNVSKFHLHRIFKEQLHANIYETIKSVRLQKAANLLIANKDYTITEIGNMCGYSIHTSFLRAFKSHYNQTPKQWREGGYIEHFQAMAYNDHRLLWAAEDFSHLIPKIVTVRDREVYYIRYRGYDNYIEDAWGKLKVWIQSNDIKNYNRIGVYYDNPAVTPLDQSYYVACIESASTQMPINASLPKSHIRGGAYAVFSLDGDYDNILKLIQWAYLYWLPRSGFNTVTASSYCIFEENTFSETQQRFKCLYHLPIGLRF
jgi:AraC family transcriptional regulator